MPMLLQSAIVAGIDKWISSVRQRADLPLRLELPGSVVFDLGEFDSPRVTVRAQDLNVLAHLATGQLDVWGEAYVEGYLDLDGRVSDIADVAYRLAALSAPAPKALARLMRLSQGGRHTRDTDKTAIRYHYDVSNVFYQLWLDRNMVYSCAYFPNGGEDLDTAQLQKIDHILRKIGLQPGQTLLDIGCGWGALVIRAAEKFGARCVGITLSERQYDLAVKRVCEHGLQDRVEIRVQDYRDVTGRFDRITSVGMFEHLGVANLPAYFAKVDSLLKDDGIVMNHGITSTDADNGESPLRGGAFIDRYVFPGGELPHLSTAIHAMQRAGLEVLDVENLRRHYARTLTLWSRRFEANQEAIRKEIGEKRFRIWRVYLVGCAYGFDVDNISIFQVLARKARKAPSGIPWSRRYMYVDPGPSD